MLINAFNGQISFYSVIVDVISVIIVVFITLPIHEFAHGFVAYKLGDPTPRWQGRLTLNPMAHIDWMGAAAMLLLGIGWAKPVQVNSNYFKKPKRDMAITALAGPTANLIVAFLSLLIANALRTFLPGIRAVFFICDIFGGIAGVNIFLAVFNLIPIPPLDGSRLLAAFLPDRQYYALMRYERYLFIAVIVLMATNVLSRPLSMMSNAIFNAISILAYLPFALF